MAAIVFGDQTVNLYNWAGYMNNRGCDFLAAAASFGQILPAFTSTNLNVPSVGYNVRGKLEIVHDYLLDGNEPISARLDAAEQVYAYLMSCSIAAGERANDLDSWSTVEGCGWSSNYLYDSQNGANVCSNQIGEMFIAYEYIRDTLLAAQNQEIDEAQVQVELNSAIAELNNKIAQTQQAQDAAKVTGFIKDVLVYVLPVIAVVFLYIAFFRNKIK